MNFISFKGSPGMLIPVGNALLPSGVFIPAVRGRALTAVPLLFAACVE